MRFRLYPTGRQEVLLLEQCAHARFVWNLGLEQRLMWRHGRAPTPGFNAQCQQLTEARRAESWLADGSQTVQQQALRDLDRAWRNFFGGTHSRPSWRKQGRHEGFRIVGAQALRVRQDRGILAAGWSMLLTRLEQKAPGRVEKVNPAYTSQTCYACKHIAKESRESQARFLCVACGYQANADVNAARNIASGFTVVGRTIAARGDMVEIGRSVKREPQLAASA